MAEISFIQRQQYNQNLVMYSHFLLRFRQVKHPCRVLWCGVEGIPELKKLRQQMTVVALAGGKENYRMEIK